MFVPLADNRDDESYEDPLDLMDEIDRLKEAKQATILAHYGSSQKTRNISMDVIV